MEAEVVVDFHNIVTFEKTTNWLVEKLKSSVSISQPVFYHSPGKLSELRYIACLDYERQSPILIIHTNEGPVLYRYRVFLDRRKPGSYEIPAVS